jgi:bifunctional NMN adenylyltransferase/nudix hydrolase
MSKIGVFIARIQPLHNAHLEIFKTALQESEHLIVVLGSACQAKSHKNPWTTKEREEMLRSCLTEDENKRLSVISLKDYYNNNLWITAMQSAISQLTINGQSVEDHEVTLFGHHKDDSTVYLNMFPYWKRREIGSLGSLCATTVRNLYFEGNFSEIEKLVPKPVYKKLNDDSATEIYQSLRADYLKVEDEKKKWAGAPYTPVFVTTDAVVIKSGHVLVIRRKGFPGKGLLALPGGYLEPSETLFECCLRELKEETGIMVPMEDLRAAKVSEQVFDYPYRDLRGRIISHAYCFNLGSGPLPKVTGSDDAEKAWWMPLCEVMKNEELFFADHFNIISCHAYRFH